MTMSLQAKQSNLLSDTNNTFQKVYNIVSQIKKGRVTTYKEIAQVLSTSPRVVGNALHANRNPKIPCHRVVNRDGRIAKNYAFGGAVKQREKLKQEGIMFKDTMHVDLEKHLLRFNLDQG